MSGVVYKSQLDFLCDTLKKCHLNTSFFDLQKADTTELDIGLKRLLSIEEDKPETLARFTDRLENNTVYKLCDSFGCTYIFLKLPEYETETLFIIGPYIHFSPERTQILEWCESEGKSVEAAKHLELYYSSVPILPETNQIFALLDTFAEIIFGGAEKYSVLETLRETLTSPFPLENDKSKYAENAVLDMQIMERRYALENEIMQAVSQGHSHKLSTLLNSISFSSFEKRTADPLRNGKNFCIIMNTLLRKAAENGGVHPIGLDRTSSYFAVKIEQLKSERDVRSLMREMFRSYCVLVKKHSVKNYSAPVQKAITCIERDFSSPLCLDVLAKMLNISAGYLSTVFKKETGKSVTEYINRRRVSAAKSLLEKTHLQVQTIAQHCGIMDVNYFSKVFKKYCGMTPKEYRNSLKNQ